MAWCPGDSLVIGISSRALFNLDEEDRIYREEGTEAFIKYQRTQEEKIIQRGVAFPLIKELLGLNGRLGTAEKPAIEIVVISKNHPDCAVRVRRSVEHHGLRFRRAIFTGGQVLLPYLRALKVDLFLSKEEQAVRHALEAGIPAGLIYGGPSDPVSLDGPPVFAFDGDAVLFSDEADRIYQQESLPGFERSELQNARVPLPKGPLHRFAKALEELRADSPIDSPPFRIVLVTARDFTYCERPIRTLRSWGIRVDQAYFVGNMSKKVVLDEIRPLIFFDDSPRNCAEASVSTPTVQIPVLQTTTVISTMKADDRPGQFMTICKLVLKRSFNEHEPKLREWQNEHLDGLNDDQFTGFIGEFERSAVGTPKGLQRRAVGAQDEEISRLFSFLDSLLKKHRE